MTSPAEIPKCASDVSQSHVASGEDLWMTVNWSNRCWKVRWQYQHGGCSESGFHSYYTHSFNREHTFSQSRSLGNASFYSPVTHV